MVVVLAVVVVAFVVAFVVVVVGFAVVVVVVVVAAVVVAGVVVFGGISPLLITQLPKIFKLSKNIYIQNIFYLPVPRPMQGNLVHVPGLG